MGSGVASLPCNGALTVTFWRSVLRMAGVFGVLAEDALCGDFLMIREDLTLSKDESFVSVRWTDRTFRLSDAYMQGIQDLV
jgi:hypothetical protein